ncbi:GDYXXLXY domain-containing protein [Xanthobacter autotrophicus DSM 431]|uniref:GDYXXLXY domain-containing protein n=1 Tax=Xanthobacter nonsaccharivorans TaxID=3119912 RepID=UPI003728404E
MMRRVLFLVAGLAVLAVLGWSVRDFETLLASGEVVLLQLAPADPRSLMQGDYMRLAYALERERIDLDAPAGAIILALDARRIGSFRRSVGAPGPGEVAFKVGRSTAGDGVVIEPHSFLFQEGHAELYARARYGIFHVDRNGRHLLIGLADADARKIEPR